MGGLVSHTGQQVAVSVQRYRYGGVDQELLDEFRVRVLGEEQRAAGCLMRWPRVSA